MPSFTVHTAAKKAVELIGYYRRLHGRPPEDGDPLPYRLTTSGAWAASRPAHLFHFFREIELSRFRLFVDLGSGDGIVACLAGLFTGAIGVEADPQLVSTAQRAARDLRLDNRVGFIRANFLGQKLQAADCLYIYPDKPVYALEEELEGWGGTLLIYGPHFPPKKLRLKTRLRCGRETLSVYTGSS
ncbi:MAG: hypothetical protein AB9866_04350 [Syntrophobacteraceae bacterium]